MPLVKHEVVESGAEIALWKITETVEELVILLQKGGIYADLPFFRNQNRLAEWLATRVLLSNLGVQQRVAYDEMGKPHLEGAGKFLSISHSGDMIVVIMHASLRVGIDIEKLGERIFKVQHKFVNDSENQWINTETRMEQLYVIWGAKECAFKIFGLGEIDFRDHLTVAPFEFGARGITEVRFKKGENDCIFRVFFQYLDQVMITYAIAS